MVAVVRLAAAAAAAGSVFPLGKSFDIVAVHDLEDSLVMGLIE